jgi:hypothetical protein
MALLVLDQLLLSQRHKRLTQQDQLNQYNILDLFLLNLLSVMLAVVLLQQNLPLDPLLHPNLLHHK